MRKITSLSIIILLLCAATAAYAALPSSRYFHSGDGVINISRARGGAAFSGRYRKADGAYDPAAMRKIYAVLGASYGNPISAISPRLIEFLDYIQDHFNPQGRISIASGFRSPSYNTNLRNNGKLAAKASLHQYGMAVDMSLSGVKSDAIWEFVKDLGFGGAGFYHGNLVHVDVGPARFWDEETSGVFTDKSDDNKLIELVDDKDIYLPGEPMELRFIRMTAFPIGVSTQFTLEQEQKPGEWKKAAEFAPQLAVTTADACPSFADIGQMMGIKWTLPADLKPGRYRVRASFCNKEWEKMPDAVATPEFEVLAP